MQTGTSRDGRRRSFSRYQLQQAVGLAPNSVSFLHAVGAENSPAKKKKQVVVWRWVDFVCAALKPGPTISGRKSDLAMGQAAGEGAGKGCAELLGDS